MYGSNFYSQTVDRVSYIENSNVIINENLVGYDLTGNKWTVINCLVGNLDSKSENINDSGQSARMHFDFLKFNSSSTSCDVANIKRFDWFLTGKVDILFERSTLRTKQPKTKFRNSESEYFDANRRPPYSISRDFTVLNCNIGECIIAKVPQEYLPDELNGICFEFRKNVDEVTPTLIRDIKHFTSFLIGTKFSYVGYSIVSGNEIVERYFVSPTLHKNMRGGLPPVPSSYQYNWSRFEYLINLLFSKYTATEKILQLNQAISRYWTAQHQAIGLNLPILANSLEILANNYFKMIDVDEFTYTTEDSYLDILGDEFKKIKVKLLTIQGGDIIINKIMGSFRKGPNEKMHNFYSLLGLKLGKEEKKALNLRNKMAHGAPDYSDTKKMHEHLHLSHVYEMLLNRTILRILGYNEYYCDYSHVDLPIKHITLSSGAK